MPEATHPQQTQDGDYIVPDDGSPEAGAIIPRKPDRSVSRSRRRIMRAATPTQYRAPVAFPSRDDARVILTENPNAAKRDAAQLDRDSATAKRDGAPTKGARLARSAPLGNRGSRYGNVRTPSLPLGPPNGR